MKKRILYCLSLYLIPGMLYGQFQLNWNAGIDLELTRAGEESHYFYNEIHQNQVGWRFDLAQANFAVNAELNPQWSINSQVLVERFAGLRIGLFKEFGNYRVRIPRLNISWKHKAERWSVKLGRFITPFGRFYQKQQFIDRSIIHNPLAYSYYGNVSKAHGFVPGLAEDDKLILDGLLDWGSSMLYRLGYVSGVQLQYSKPEQIEWTFAITSQAINTNPNPTLLKQIGLISRFGFSPNYFSKFGVSLSYGTFLERRDLNASLSDLNRYTQALIGIDYQLGAGFFEVSGEFITALYQVPFFNSEAEIFDSNGDIFQAPLVSTSGYIDLKQELSFFPGSFLAFRLDFLHFGNYTTAGNERKAWDDNVFRQALGFGYKVNDFWQLRLSVSTQQVKNRDWDQHQRLFRLMTSFHW